MKGTIRKVESSLIVQSKPDVLVSNLLQLKEIERYHKRHPSLSIDQAAMVWIEKNSAKWRRKHSFAI